MLQPLAKLFRSSAPACIALLIATSAIANAREFRVADTQAADYPTVQALQLMARIIEERTAGRHRLRIFHSRQLGEEKETIEQTRIGAIDINRTNVAPIGSFVPAANVLSLPFLFRSSEHLRNALDDKLGQDLLAGFQPYGFVGLTFYEFRREVDLQQRQARAFPGGYEGTANSSATVEAHVGHGEGLGSRAD